METNQIIIFSICLIAAFILFKVLKSILKILIPIIIILVGSYYIYNSLNNIDLVDGISNLYCSDESYNEAKCECISSYVINELSSSKTELEIESLRTDPVLGLNEISKILYSNKDEISDCLEGKGEEILSIDKIINDFKAMITK